MLLPDRRVIKPVLIAAVALALAVSVVKLWRYSPYKMSRDMVANPEFVLSLSGVQIAGMHEGRQSWSFKADRVDVSRGRVITTARGVHDGKLYGDNKVVATLNAGTLMYDCLNGNVEITNGVHIDGAKGFHAAAANANWFALGEQLTCSGTVKFKAGDSTLMGQNLSADLRKGEASLDHGKLSVAIADMETAGPERSTKNMGKVNESH